MNYNCLQPQAYSQFAEIHSANTALNNNQYGGFIKRQ